MNNFDKLLKIEEIILYKKFDYFIRKYKTNLSQINIKKVYFDEFNIKSNYSEEFILFIDYLIKHNYVIKN